MWNTRRCTVVIRLRNRRPKIRELEATSTKYTVIKERHFTPSLMYYKEWIENSPFTIEIYT